MCFGRRVTRRIFLGGRFEIKLDFSTVAQRILFQDITRNLTVTSIRIHKIFLNGWHPAGLKFKMAIENLKTRRIAGKIVAKSQNYF